MRTTYPVALIICVGIVAAIVSASGFWGAVGLVDDQPGVSSAVNDSADKYNPNQGLEGEAAAQDDGNIVGLILSGGSNTFSIFSIINLFPNTLMWLGMPSWAAFPLGWPAQILAFIGGTQFVLGRVLQ
ncbi:hypothetical protein [Halomarina oriensis]|uniref:Uncharacterized protein n=1 Tax=Halomarina oriensis TaxID=671145 RepID=A0A6B0GML6_9EURY|nr:hypothetical protein [Halomarina oriensis]MWG35900.1 hypothetical protein [Halomarina oriensis]